MSDTMKIILTPKQKKLLASFFEDGEEFTHYSLCLEDSEERTALALERKGLVSLNGTFETADVAEAKAIVRARGFSYCLYMQGFAMADNELQRAAHILMQRGYLLAHENGDLVGTFGPLNDKFPLRKPKLVVSND